MRITKEWAKQLAYEVWGELDFAEMVISYVPIRIQIVKTALLNEQITFNMTDPRYPAIDYDEIILEHISDPINQEITSLGYSKKANHLVIGETIPIPNEYNTMTRLP